MIRSAAPTVLLVEPDKALAHHVQSLLERDGYEVVLVRSGREAYRYATQQAPDVVIVDVTLPDTDGHELTKSFRKNQATFNLPILLLTKSSDPASKIAVVEAGADDHLTRPFHPDALLYRVKSILVRSHGPGAELAARSKRGRIIAFFGCKGGIGGTTLAVNAAVGLRLRKAGRVALFDTAFAFGDVGVHLDLRPHSDVMELVRHLEDLEPSTVETFMAEHKTGLRVLLGPPSPEQGEMISGRHVELLTKYLAELYDYVIIDCPTNYDDRTLTVLEHADDIVLITTPEVSAIRNTTNFISLATRLKLPLKKIHVVLNRADSNAHIGVAEIERILHHPVSFRVISSGRALVRSLTRGVPLVLEQEQHPFSQQVLTMVDSLMGRPRVLTTPRPAGPKLLTKLATREEEAGDGSEPAAEPAAKPRSRLQSLWDSFWGWLTGTPTSAR